MAYPFKIHVNKYTQPPTTEQPGGFQVNLPSVPVRATLTDDQGNVIFDKSLTTGANGDTPLFEPDVYGPTIHVSIFVDGFKPLVKAIPFSFSPGVCLTPA